MTHVCFVVLSTIIFTSKYLYFNLNLINKNQIFSDFRIYLNFPSLISAQVLPTVAASTADFTSILVSQEGARTPTVQPQPLQPQNPHGVTPPDVILQTLPNVVSNFLGQSATAAKEAKSVIEPLTTSFLFNGQLSATNGMTATTVTKVNTIAAINKATEQTTTTELTHLADLESITDFLGMAAANNNNENNSNRSGHPVNNNSGGAVSTSDLDLMDSFESTKLDWESSSSGSGGSHFEFSCTQDVSEMLCDIGVNEPVDWGVDDIMIRI